MSRASARRLLGVPEGAKVVGTVGRLDHQKAPHDLVAVWVGDGPLRRQTQHLVGRAGLHGRFLLLGERHDVPALLPGFDVFALSSLYEGLPCALVEAVTCGIPVVATAVNAVPEVVVAGRTGLLVPPAHPPSLTRALGYLLDHPDHAARLAAAATPHVGNRFRPDALGPDLEEVYGLALGLTPAMPAPVLAEAKSA